MRKENQSIKADDITDVKLSKVDWQWNAGYVEYAFDCKICGTPDRLYLLEQRTDDGPGISIYAEKTELWQNMSTAEIWKLDGKLREQMAYDGYHNRIQNLQNIADWEALKYELWEDTGAHLQKSKPKIWKEYAEKGKELKQMERAQKPSLKFEKRREALSL